MAYSSNSLYNMKIQKVIANYEPLHFSCAVPYRVMLFLASRIVRNIFLLCDGYSHKASFVQVIILIK